MGDVLRSEVARGNGGNKAGASRWPFFVMPCPRSNRITWWGFSPGGKIEEIYPGYHGEIAIDPSTGAILRISLLAELPPPYQAMQTAILVEYAPVRSANRAIFARCAA